MDFKALFDVKNTYDLLSQLNSVAVEYYKDTMDNGIKDMEQLRYFLLCLDRVYQEGFESPLRDNEYDDLHEFYIDNGGTIIRGDLSSTDKAVHVYPSLKGTIRKVHFITEKDRLETGKVKSQKSFESWYRNVIGELQDLHVIGDIINLGFYTKFDGLSVILEIEDGKVKSAITRGDKDTGAGQDKTAMFSQMDFKNLCKKLGVSAFGMKCEAVMKKSLFDEYNKKYGQSKLIDSRTAVSSILNMDYPTKDQMSYVTLIPLMVMIDGVEFPIPNESLPGFEWTEELYYWATLKASVEQVKETLEAVKDVIKWMSKQVSSHYDYPVDGIVIRIEDEQFKAILGRNETECVNNWERAYKFPPARAKTVLLDIQQEIGILGKLSFVAKVQPVKLKNKTIKSISIGSLDRFNILDLAVGDEVWVEYDIIPYLTVDGECKRSKNPPIKVITQCPACGSDLQFDPEYGCVNPECPTRIMGKIYNYCNKLDIEGIGPESIARMYHAGILYKISDLYRLTVSLLETIFGPVESKNIVKAINKVKEVDDYVFFGALGIPSVSRKIFERVLKKLTVDELLGFRDDKRSYERLFDVEGIKSKTAKRIITGLIPMHDEIYELMKHIKLKRATSYDKTVCFTKVRDHEFEAYLNSINIGVTEALTRKTALLIAGSMDSTKVAKAIKWKIPVITLEDAYKLFNYKP